MKHLSAKEIIDFLTMTDIDEKSLKNASAVTTHITECDECMRTVRAFQKIRDEFENLEMNGNNKNEAHIEYGLAAEFERTLETGDNFPTENR